MREGAVIIENGKKKQSLRVECPKCGYKMPIYYDETAECKGVTISCKGRNCHHVFEIKIEHGKQIK